MALKYSSVNKELLNIIKLTPEDLYKKIEGKVSLGFHSDGSPLVTLKSKHTQVMTSTDAIFNAIEVLVKITQENPTLHRVENIFADIANNVAEGYSMAYTANVLNGTLTDCKDKFEKAEGNLIKVLGALRKSNVAKAQNFSFSVDSERVIKSDYEFINETYLMQQEAILKNEVSDQGHLKLTTAKHNVNINPAIVNSVLSGHYKALITQSLFNDCLNHKINEVIERADNSPSNNIHLGSTKQIIKALKEGIEKSFDMSEAVNKINSHSQLAEKMVEVAGDLVIDIPKKSKFKP